jgi:hypothetical protein
MSEEKNRKYRPVIHIKVDQSSYDAIQRMATEQRRSVTNLVETLIVKALEYEANVADQMKTIAGRKR